LTEENTVLVYNNSPIFKDFLKYNDANYSFLENMKDKLKEKKWSDLTKEERCYYLSNKRSYLQSIVKNKITEKSLLEKKVEMKKQHIEKLKEEIKKKELFFEDQKNKISVENCGNELYLHLEKQKQIDMIDKQIQDISEKTNLLENKIDDCNKMLVHYEHPKNSLPIGEIIKGLKEEKNRIKVEIEHKHSKVKELETRINYYKESIQILEIKNK
jgi:hypothetical protein